MPRKNPPPMFSCRWGLCLSADGRPARGDRPRLFRGLPAGMPNREQRSVSLRAACSRLFFLTQAREYSLARSVPESITVRALGMGHRGQPFEVRGSSLCIADDTMRIGVITRRAAIPHPGGYICGRIADPWPMPIQMMTGDCYLKALSSERAARRSLTVRLRTATISSASWIPTKVQGRKLI